MLILKHLFYVLFIFYIVVLLLHLVASYFTYGIHDVHMFLCCGSLQDIILSRGVISRGDTGDMSPARFQKAETYHHILLYSILFVVLYLLLWCVGQISGHNQGKFELNPSNKEKCTWDWVGTPWAPTGWVYMLIDLGVTIDHLFAAFRCIKYFCYDHPVHEGDMSKLWKNMMVFCSTSGTGIWKTGLFFRYHVCPPTHLWNQNSVPDSELLSATYCMLYPITSPIVL